MATPVLLGHTVVLEQSTDYPDVLKPHAPGDHHHKNRIGTHLEEIFPFHSHWLCSGVWMEMKTWTGSGINTASVYHCKLQPFHVSCDSRGRKINSVLLFFFFLLLHLSSSAVSYNGSLAQTSLRCCWNTPLGQTQLWPLCLTNQQTLNDIVLYCSAVITGDLCLKNAAEDSSSVSLVSYCMFCIVLWYSTVLYIGYVLLCSIWYQLVRFSVSTFGKNLKQLLDKGSTLFYFQSIFYHKLSRCYCFSVAKSILIVDSPPFVLFLISILLFVYAAIEQNTLGP